MKRITSVLLATFIASMSVLGIAESAFSATHNYRRHTTILVRRNRNCIGRNRYRSYRGRYYRCRYYRNNRRHH